ncbi:MAG: DUF4835 family protein [Saprospiraceae bacterium]
MNRVIISFLFLLVVGVTKAQEFNATVKINTPKLQTADPAIFKTLEKAVNQLITGTAWTEDEFEEFEKINTNITINITEEVSATSFKAELLIQATRPIFNTSQETQLFAISDSRVSFSYEQFQPLEFTKNVYSNNLTSIISYYCYMILGYDYDTFSPNGGTPYYQLAQDVLTNIPPNIVTSDDGWSAVKGKNKNRYWLLENVLSPRVSLMRSAFYDYHLRGLDRMTEDVVEARKSIANALTKISQVNRSYPNAMIVRLFALAKGDEILQIFIVENYAVRKKIYDAMIKIDATNASKYEPLLKR